MLPVAKASFFRARVCRGRAKIQQVALRRSRCAPLLRAFDSAFLESWLAMSEACAAGRVEWLPDKDLNLDKQIQSLLCYHYTIGQRHKKVN